MKIIGDFLQEEKITTKESEKTIAVDFDGVCHAYSKGYHTGKIYDPPKPGTKQALELLSKKYKLVLFTTRALLDGTEEIVKWLKKYDLEKYFVKITYKKVPFVKLIDDNAITFKSWSQVLGDLKNENLI